MDLGFIKPINKAWGETTDIRKLWITWILEGWDVSSPNVRPQIPVVYPMKALNLGMMWSYQSPLIVWFYSRGEEDHGMIPWLIMWFYSRGEEDHEVMPWFNTPQVMRQPIILFPLIEKKKYSILFSYWTIFMLKSPPLNLFFLFCFRRINLWIYFLDKT